MEPKNKFQKLKMFTKLKFKLPLVLALVIIIPSLIGNAEAAKNKNSTKKYQTLETNYSNTETPVEIFEEGSETSTVVSKPKSKGRSSSRRASKDEQEPKSSKISPIKPSWLAVANSMAQSESNQQLPISDDSKPTKYHYYPHNQHLYLLPECATQQVCSAVYLRLNYSQPLCACPSFHKPCSVSTRTDDRHTIPLVTGSHSQVLTLVKTCEPTNEVRECRAPKDWSILALQNSRTGKAHYLVICRCPSPGYLEGPIAHSQPAYARVPGIRVYGMTCRLPLPQRTGRDVLWTTTTTTEAPITKVEVSRGPHPTFPWTKIKTLLKSAGIIS